MREITLKLKFNEIKESKREHSGRQRENDRERDKDDYREKEEKRKRR